MVYDDELVFEKDLSKVLSQHGWEKEVLHYKDEAFLVNNWKEILFANNRQIDRLNGFPLTDSEMQQIIEQINSLKTPNKLNGFINGKTVSIRRDNPDDKLHFGKEISLKIYDRQEIAAGASRYQIATEPRFSTPDILNSRRGDVILLINGMPVIHLELKRSSVHISNAVNQIEKYSHEGVYRGLFSLVQIMVAMTPEETIYFANPGEDNRFNSNFHFHWADFNNTPINDWKDIASTLLSIPMAHQLIGFYTIADNTDGLLKVMRSYQYYAANAISVKVGKRDWSSQNIRGGHIWHTTGSGKTMTSFKSAQLIATSNNADKVIFLVDRIELGTQSLREYRNFANEDEEVQATENSGVLITKLKSTETKNTLIVTSIQKMSEVSDDPAYLKTSDLKLIKSKRIVIIVDEAHRSTFGEMLYRIKNTFSNAMFFGFTGTPIQDENDHKNSTTTDVFGDELHRYSIADGIRDKNVLGFDPYKVSTYTDRDLRKVIALNECKAHSVEEALADEEKKKVYYEYMNKKTMIEIEECLPKTQYNNKGHREKVVDDIFSNWDTLSVSYKYHAILTTTSIKEAIAYYKIFKIKNNQLKIDERKLNVTCLFDPNIDNSGDQIDKEYGLVELLTDYNKKYDQSFTLGSFDKFKKDVAVRLAHKEPYTTIGKDHEKQIDLLIVVNQMLTGYDSKWINTLYVDKVFEFEQIIQAFSRTNRLCGNDKSFGTIKYYRKPHTMEKNIEEAIKLYSGDKPQGIFVPKLKENVDNMNNIFEQIKVLFKKDSIDFSKLPEDNSAKAKFSKLFIQLNQHLDAAKIQGFKWEDVEVIQQATPDSLDIKLNKTTYLTLVLRYKELAKISSSGLEDIPYEIDNYLTEIKTGEIDENYMNSKFTKYLKALKTGKPEDMDRTLKELHTTFSTLSQEDQKYASIFLHDVDSGDAIILEGKTLRDYITEYKVKAKNDQISTCANTFGIDESLLRNLINKKINNGNINEYGLFEALKNTFNFEKTKEYFETKEKRVLTESKVSIKFDEFLRKFVLEGGIDI